MKVFSARSISESVTKIILGLFELYVSRETKPDRRRGIDMNVRES